jgi:uncharacterized protein (DUF58 family)
VSGGRPASSGRRRWLSPPRRLLFTRAGAVFTAGILAVGLAAVNTGNNLLYLLLGGLLGVVALSGVLSERAVRRVRVVRRLPRGTPAGSPVRIRYEVSNLRRRMPVLTLEIREPSLPGGAFVPYVAPGDSVVVRNDPLFIRRGTVPLETVTLSTGFPFGLFRKERDLVLPGEVVVWPSTNRPAPELRLGGDRIRRGGGWSGGGVAPRGDYRNLREYHSGDDPRDVHWKASARSGSLVTRQYERDDSTAAWICLDAGAPPGDAAEESVEMAASLAARTLREGRDVAFVTQGVTLPPGGGEGQLERILEALARVDFDPVKSALAPPAAPERCILVSTTGRGSGSFGQVVSGGGSAA